MGDGRTDLVAVAGAEEVVGGGAVEVEGVVVTPVGHRKHERTVGGLHADVGDHPGVEDVLDPDVFVDGAVRAAPDGRAVGWSVGHGGRLGGVPAAMAGFRRRAKGQRCLLKRRMARGAKTAMMMPIQRVV